MDVDFVLKASFRGVFVYWMGVLFLVGNEFSDVCLSHCCSLGACVYITCRIYIYIHIHALTPALSHETVVRGLFCWELFLERLRLGPLSSGLG